MKRSLFLWAFFALLISLAPSFAQQAPQVKTLDNGLTVLVQENHTAPVVAVRFYVRTGSIYEGEYLGSGISHLFEHTLGEGTKTRTKEEMNELVQGIGGQSNAYTSNDTTAYFITTSSRYFERALDGLSDEMKNATFPEVEVKTQQGVIHNEMNLGEDDPGRVLYKLFYNTAFTTHPVRYPVIGYREIFDRLSRDDIVSYYKTHYTPTNTVLSVAGDVESEQVFELAQKYLGDWERRSPLTPLLPSEPRQMSPRRAVVEKDVQVAQLMAGWHTVPLQHPDLYALDVLAEIFGGGESSRLVRSLRETQNLVSGIGAYSQTPRYDAGIFAVTATLPPENINKVGNAIWLEVEKIQKNGVTAAEVSRAQRQMEAAFVFGNEQVDDQAERIAYDYMGTGDPTYSEQYVAGIKRVTPAQVQAMANKYLRRDGITTAILKPRSTGSETTVAGTPPPTAASNAAVEPARMVTLPNGMRLIVRENHNEPTVAIAAMGLGGARLEPAGKAGIANLTAEMLTRGTTTRNAEEIARTVAELGGAFNTSSGYNSWVANSQWLARDWRSGLSLLQESLLQPTFPADELQRVKAQTLAAIQQSLDDPEGEAALLLRQTYYGDHPYGRLALGQPEQIAGITPAELKAYWRGTLQPNSTVMAVYGDIDADEVIRVVKYLFRDLKSVGGVTPPPAAPQTPQQFTAKAEEKPGLAQAVIMYAYPGMPIADEDRYAITVLDGALSGIYYPGGRLHKRLRDNQLVYGVHAYNAPGIGTAMFVVQAATTKDKLAEVERIIEEEIGNIRDNSITAEELERAKSMAIAARAVELQSNGSQAGEAVSNELFGLGYQEGQDYEEQINAITAADVQRVAQKYLLASQAARAIVQAP